MTREAVCLHACVFFFFLVQLQEDKLLSLLLRLLQPHQTSSSYRWAYAIWISARRCRAASQELLGGVTNRASVTLEDVMQPNSCTDADKPNEERHSFNLQAACEGQINLNPPETWINVCPPASTWVSPSERRQLGRRVTLYDNHGVIIDKAEPSVMNLAHPRLWLADLLFHWENSAPRLLGHHVCCEPEVLGF